MTADKVAGDEPSGARRRVVVTGFMAAGKTTVGRRLARLLSCAFIDLDEFVTGREGRTPQQLIDEEGEPRFRDAETDALRAALATPGDFVVALGGGAWTLERNRALIAARGCHAVWLDAPFELCWARVRREGGRSLRPLARDEGRARQLYESRRAAYALAGHRVAVAEGATAGELAEVVVELIGGGHTFKPV